MRLDGNRRYWVNTLCDEYISGRKTKMGGVSMVCAGPEEKEEHEEHLVL